ncbi:hypothetical protein ACLMJK_005356 [Lecanora helva]
MKVSPCHFLAFLALVNASPKPQVNISSGLPTPPAFKVSPSPSPFANAALWQEAVANDAKIGSTDNRSFYAAVAYAQTLENSSNSIIADALEGAETISKALQALNIYPTDFNQEQALDPATTPVVISSTPQQIIKSFGASGAWWPNDLNFFPPAQQKNLSSLLFDKEWLYLSGYRYNVGATGDQDSLQINPALRSVQSFMKTDGTYDWTRDGPGIYFLKAAQAAGVSSITFFVNAQPSGMTSNHQACGSVLDSPHVAAYVAYIEKIVAYWADQGIPIDFVSPMNEPDDSFQKCSFKSGCTCGQEGMAVSSSTRATVFKQLRAALSSSKSAGVKKIKIMGDETSQITTQALAEYVGSTNIANNGQKYSGWLPDTLEGEYIDAIAVHMYDWPDDATLKNYRQLIINASRLTTHKKPPPPIKMTELSSYASARGLHAPYGWTGTGLMTSEFDPTIDNALDMARMIWQWMTLVNAESFDWWTALSTMMPCTPTTNPTCPYTYQSGQGWNDALIYLDSSYGTNKNYEFYLTKRFWVFKHFTTFVRPGSVRYDIPNEVLPYGTVALASKGTDDTWSSIFINRNTTDQTITLRLPGIGAKLVGLTQTTAADDWKSLALPIISRDNSIKLILPARGVMSVQFTVSDPRPMTATAQKARRRVKKGSPLVTLRAW